MIGSEPFFWVDVYKETAGFTNMNKAYLLPRKPHKSKKLEGYLDFPCAFQLKQRYKLPEICVTLQGQLGPLFPDSQWMEGRQRMLTLLCKGRLGGNSSMDFWDVFFWGGMSLLQDPLNCHFCDIWIHLEKEIHSQKKVQTRTQQPSWPRYVLGRRS